MHFEFVVSHYTTISLDILGLSWYLGMPDKFNLLLLYTKLKNVKMFLGEQGHRRDLKIQLMDFV